MRSIRALAPLLGLVACSRPSAPSTVTSASAPPAASVSAPDDLRVEVGLPGHVVVRNDRDVPVRIAWKMPMQHESGGTWSDVHTLEAKTSCTQLAPADDCVTIAAHASLEPRPWTGWFGCTQCGSCRANVPAGEGRYRAVAVECGSGARHVGPVMEIVEAGRLAGTPKVHAPADDPSALEIENPTDTPMSFRTEVEVLELDRVHNAWNKAEVPGMTLESVCAGPPPPCTTVPAHGKLRTLAFRSGCAVCAKCNVASRKPGTWRMRVSVCDPSAPYYDDVFGASFTTKAFTDDGKAKVVQTND